MKKILVTFLVMVLFSFSSANAAEGKIRAVVSFSILGDIVQNIGGDKVEVISLVDADSDAHVFEPKPYNAKIIAGSDIVFVNGLGFEGWIGRLIEQSGYKGKVIQVSDGVRLIENAEDGAHHHHEHSVDPHVWHDVRNVIIFVKNIEKALINADRKNQAYYKARAKEYSDKLKKLDSEIKTRFAGVPANQRKVITSHDAFAYFAKAYRIKFIGLQGLSTSNEASAKDIANIADLIKKQNVKAVFIENISDKKLMEQVAKEAKIKIYGKLYSDALSGFNGEAKDYISMMEYNSSALKNAMLGK